jgi:hypothetical protein
MLSPFYWEDDDLGYRALKRGYKVIYDPSVSVIHKNAVSSARLPSAYITAMKEKNMLLFLWKNLTYKPYLKEYLRSLPKRIDIALKKGSYTHIMPYVLAFLQAGFYRRLKEVKDKIFDKRSLLWRMEKSFSSFRQKHILLLTLFPPYPLNNGGALRVYNLVKNRSGLTYTMSFVESKRSRIC